MIAAEIKLNNKVASMTTAQLCELFEATNGNRDPEIPVVRGAIMDQLMERNAVAFNAWMDCEVVADMEKPSRFFL